METLWPTSKESSESFADALCVWVVRLDAVGALGEEVAATLSAEERQRAEQFRLEQARRRFVLTRAALRTLLGKQMGVPPREVPLVLGMHGKPRLADGACAVDWRFNVTHSGEIALIAMTIGCEVGVDIELVRPVRQAEHIARRYFHPRESAAVRAAASGQRDVTFLRIWTAKEAVLKALGKGIAGSLTGFSVPTGPHDGAWIDVPDRRCWLQPLEPVHGYVGAAATVEARRAAQLFTLDWREM
jgi:4'-phosphopantetheinyl transferase